MFVKICGLTDRSAVDAAVAAGADAIGFVFAESPREIEPERAAALCRGVPDSMRRVAVMRHPSPDRFRAVVETLDPDWIQSDAEDFADLPFVPQATLVPVYREGDAVDCALLPRRLLFEGRASGSGRIADWEEARELAIDRELILAGGLDVSNVADAIEYVRPWGVDVSTGVEIERGRKDPRKIEEFIARVRALESQS